MIMSFATWLENLDFFTFIRGSGNEYPAILALHLVGMALFGGMILLTDLRMLGWILPDQSIASIVNATRWPKRIGFLWVATCGFILAASKAEGYLLNAFFQLKLTLFALVFVHAMVFRGSVYNHPEELDKPPQPPGRAKLAASLSLVLWLGIMCAGRGIGYLNAPPGLHYAAWLRTILKLIAG
jgi:uncharacterized protein DUF6644